MVWRPALGPDHHPVVTAVAEDERRRPSHPGDSPDGGEKQDRGTAPLLSVLATGFLVNADVLGPK
jgi:hypothetical protein